MYNASKTFKTNCQSLSKWRKRKEDQHETALTKTNVLKNMQKECTKSRCYCEKALPAKLLADVLQVLVKCDGDDPLILRFLESANQ